MPVNEKLDEVELLAVTGEPSVEEVDGADEESVGTLGRPVLLNEP